MADALKPVYLIHGDDDARIDDWRVRLRRRAESEQGPGALTAFDARESGPGVVAAEMSALTFATGTRYLLAEDASVWKQADLDPIVAALDPPPPETVLVLIVRGKPLKGLLKAVEKAGGEVRQHAAPKPWELPRWVLDRAKELGVSLDRDAAQTLVDLAGPSRRRLASELDKLTTAIHPERRIGSDDVERLVAGDAVPAAWDVADAVVARDAPRALRLTEELLAWGEEPGRLLYPVKTKLRDTRRAVSLLESGMTEAAVAKELGGPPWKTKKVVAAARDADLPTLDRAIAQMAKLEVDLRGGLPWRPSGLSGRTALTLALVRAAA